VASNNELVTRQVEVLRRLNDSVYVGKGLNDGDLVITTPVGTPREGTKLRIRGSEEEQKNYHGDTKENKKHEIQKLELQNAEEGTE
jgi:hypothetical protein